MFGTTFLFEISYLNGPLELGDEGFDRGSEESNLNKVKKEQKVF